MGLVGRGVITGYNNAANMKYIIYCIHYRVCDDCVLSLSSAVSDFFYQSTHSYIVNQKS